MGVKLNRRTVGGRCGFETTETLADIANAMIGLSHLSLKLWKFSPRLGNLLIGTQHFLQQRNSFWRQGWLWRQLDSLIIDRRGSRHQAGWRKSVVKMVQ